MPQEPRPVPVRTILATIGLVLATVVGLYLVVLLARIEAWLLIAAFFAVVLNQPVEFFRRHLHISRGLSALVVYLVGITLVSGMLYAVIRPLVDQVQEFADSFPEFVAEARAGEGTVGKLVKRYDLDRRIEENRDRIDQWISSAGGGAVSVARSVASGLLALLTILVLSFLMILYGPDLLVSGLGMLSPPRRERVEAVARDCSRALTGYVMGNLAISVIAATVTYIGLLVFDVPFAGVLALWVGFTDLIPLVGATLGAIPTVGVAFLHSNEAGFGMLILYIVYQQFENHVLQVVIMSKTVQINQLFVLVSVLMGVELFGFVGALLAIPAAGVLQVVVRDLWDFRRGAPKPEPTIGEEEIPVSEHLAEQAEREEHELEHEVEAGADGETHDGEDAPPPPTVRREELARVADAPPPPLPPARADES
ncbi:MAG TPA: AI-2E family transporter [Acidimicrobiales bacterium]|nr:AI-2E family transporter [Acidimicrobiales bacterium]